MVVLLYRRSQKDLTRRKLTFFVLTMEGNGAMEYCLLQRYRVSRGFVDVCGQLCEWRFSH